MDKTKPTLAEYKRLIEEMKNQKREQEVKAKRSAESPNPDTKLQISRDD